MSLRVALALHGQPRFFELCYEHFFSKIIETFDADVFFHTWWSPDHIGQLYPCAPHARHAYRDDDLRIKEDTYTKLRELYKPLIWYPDWYNLVSPGINYQYYSQYRSKVAVKTAIDGMGKSYDLIIRSRFDLMCTQDIIIDLAKLDSLCVPSCCPYQGDGRVNDMFSISNWDVFDKITDTYLNIPEFKKEGKGEMEWALASQIQKHNIPVRTFPADYSSFDVLRSDTADLFR